MSASTDLLLFISHASSDASLAKVVVELLEKATKIAARQVRCTSVSGYRLPVGADTDEQLRREIFVSRAFIGILTPASVSSAYVLFELGARWGAKRHLAPVLARGLDLDLLGGPLASLNALDLTDRNQVLQLVQDAAEYLDLPLEPFASFQDAVDSVVLQARSVSAAMPQSPIGTTSMPADQLRVLHALSGDKRYRTLAEIAEQAGFSEDKTTFYLEVLNREQMIGVVQGSKPLQYHIKHDGLGVLVEHNLV